MASKKKGLALKKGKKLSGTKTLGGGGGLGKIHNLSGRGLGKA